MITKQFISLSKPLSGLIFLWSVSLDTMHSVSLVEIRKEKWPNVKNLYVAVVDSLFGANPYQVYRLTTSFRSQGEELQSSKMAYYSVSHAISVLIEKP